MNLPVPVTVFGPLHLLAVRVQELVDDSRCDEALAAADAYLALASAVDDRDTIPFLIQGKLYANLEMGRIPEAAQLGEQLRRLHRARGNLLGEAKVLCDLAYIEVVRSRYFVGVRNLARA